MEAADGARLCFFSRSRLLARAQGLHPAIAGGLVFLSMATAAVVTAVVGGRFGALEHVRLGVGDLGRAFGSIVLGRSPADTPMSFPLLRDLPSVLLALAIATTFGLIVWQWRLFEETLIKLRSEGVLHTRSSEVFSSPLNDDRASDVGPGWSSGSMTTRCRAWAYRRFVGLAPSGVDPLAHLVSETNRALAGGSAARWRHWQKVRSALPVIVACILAILLVVAERVSLLFEIIAPSSNADEWAGETYRSWWAGTSNQGGLFVYAAIAALGFYLIIVQNAAGLRAVLLISSLPFVATFSVEWLNLDGHHGWDSIRRAYRTVIWSLLVHAVSLSLLIVVVGFNGIIVLLPLVGLWIGTFVLYVFIPLAVLSGVFATAAGPRLEALKTTYETLDRVTDAASYSALSRERDWRSLAQDIRACQFHPLLSRLDRSIITVSLVTPILLTIVQVLPAVVGS